MDIVNTFVSMIFLLEGERTTKNKQLVLFNVIINIVIKITVVVIVVGVANEIKGTTTMNGLHTGDVLIFIMVVMN